jgi:hypothetical protein
MEKDGFLLFKNFFTVEEGEMIQKWADELEDWLEEKGKWMIYLERDEYDLLSISRMENFVNYHPPLKKFLDERVYPVLREIVGKDLVLFKEKINWKRGGGKGFLPHQDHPAWDDFPPSIYYSVSIFGNICYRKNGTLEFAQNLGRLRESLYHDENGSLVDPNKYDWQQINATPRDLFIFNSFIPHMSKKNFTKHSRRIFLFTYNLKEEGDYHDQYLKKKREEFPPRIEREKGKEYNRGSKYNLANPFE